MDDLTLVVNGREVSGWETLRVTRGIERLPSDFEVSMTERYPGELDFAVRAGDPCQVLLGQDKVITGYVDRYMPSISAGQHAIRVAGRGKCADLVDCAAVWDGGQFTNSSALTIAQLLSKPYGITVSGEAGSIIPQHNINWGETVFSAVETMARYSALLAYDAPDGNLILARVGTAKAASGFAQGENVERASVVYAMDQRYSQYIVRMLAMDTLRDSGSGGDLLSTVDDPNVPRPRVHYIIAESGDAGGNVAKQRGVWEMNRRFGRANQIHITTDSWRDQAGMLWTPNMLVPVSLPALKVVDGLQWLIGEVTYERDENGSHAHLVLMPPEAFSPEPIIPPWEKGFGDVLPNLGAPAK